MRTMMEGDVAHIHGSTALHLIPFTEIHVSHIMPKGESKVSVGAHGKLHA